MVRKKPIRRVVITKKVEEAPCIRVSVVRSTLQGSNKEKIELKIWHTKATTIHGIMGLRRIHMCVTATPHAYAQNRYKNNNKFEYGSSHTARASADIIPFKSFSLPCARA